MGRISQSVDISASPSAVFRYVWDAQNLPRYFPTTRVEVLESSETRVKTRHDYSLLGKTLDLVCVRLAHAAGRTITFRAEEGMALEGTWTFQEIKGGTRVTYIMDYQLPKNMQPKLFGGGKTEKEMQELCGGCVQRLKQAMEGRA
ncbi:MAG: SRPBCC family protein [Chloroflexota bacterium]